MTVDVDGQHYLVGITSFAIGCGWVGILNAITKGLYINTKKKICVTSLEIIQVLSRDEVDPTLSILIMMKTSIKAKL